MKIGLRILLGYFLILGLAAWFTLNVFVDQVKPGVRSTLEDTLADTANLLAVLVADDIKAGRVEQSALLARMRNVGRRGVAAQIGGVEQPAPDYRIHITDTHGVVLFDTLGRDVGKDFSRWNDIFLTLRGKYGARSTREVPDDDASTVMHVAAPIKDGAAIIGVLTVAKPISTVQPFVERSQQKILRRGAWLLGVSLLIGLAFAFWLSRSLGKLMRFIDDVDAGRKATLPPLGKDEIGTLGRALAAMRDKLEGKQYVEELMHTLAHELKSPIAAIQGSAELLREDMPAAERAHFLGNILEQNARQRQLIDKLLALVRVEKQQRLAAPVPVALDALLEQAVRDCAPRLAARALRIDLLVDPVSVPGDPLLLRQALGNLLDNAIAFAPTGSKIDIVAGWGDGAAAADGGQRAPVDAGDEGGKRREGAFVVVRDHGAGIPDYALGRIFERFYSLPRPDGAKSTGLGLPFVREVMALHDGSVDVANAAGGGVRAVLLWPRA